MGKLGSQQVEIERRDGELARRKHEIAFKQATIDKLTHEMAVLKRLKFAAKSEATAPSKRACWKRPSTPTWRLWPWRSSSAHRPRPTRPRSSSPSEPCCRPTCRAPNIATSLTAPPAVAAASSSASARTWPRSWTTCPVSSQWSAMSVASGCASTARRWFRPRWPRTSSTRASPPPGCWRRCW